MASNTLTSAVNMHMARGSLVVSVDADLNDQLIVYMQKSVLDRIVKRSVKGVIIDLSAVHIIDLLNMKMIYDMVVMAKLLGAHAVIVGLKAGVVSSLIDLDVNVTTIQTARTFDDAFDILDPIVNPKVAEDDEDEDEVLEDEALDEQDSLEEVELLDVDEEEPEEMLEDDACAEALLEDEVRYG